LGWTIGGQVGENYYAQENSTQSHPSLSPPPPHQRLHSRPLGAFQLKIGRQRLLESNMKIFLSGFFGSVKINQNSTAYYYYYYSTPILMKLKGTVEIAKIFEV
jgi:hypothetical protein